MAIFFGGRGGGNVGGGAGDEIKNMKQMANVTQFKFSSFNLFPSTDAAVIVGIVFGNKTGSLLFC